ncbi:MAG: D-alanyl-D-alanine carboxypeptidase [Clostridia bacterium]|nr:D-alanyl-D-alanine carboxypeptidase [Clostridia bacterium]
MNKVKITICIFFLITFFSFDISFGEYFSIPTWSSGTLETAATDVSEGNFLGLESGSAILIEQNSGEILYEHNIHEKLRPASVTKVMTILLIMEEIDNGNLSYDDMIPCSERAASMGGSQIWLDTTEELSVSDMLKAICVVSANDCTVAMAEHIAGSEEAFVERMNTRAKELGMNDTTFKNCHGIDEDGHVTSAYDISLMSRELLTKHPKITEYTTIWMDSLRNGESELVNTNKLIRNYSGATGLKTGSTSLALFNLSASATRDNLSLIAVIMRAPSTAVRFSEARKLLDYGFSNYEYNEFSKGGEKFCDVDVQKGLEATVEAVYEKSSGDVIKKGNQEDIEKEVLIDDKVTAPVEKGQKIGEVRFKIGENQVEAVNLVASKEVKKISTWNMITFVYKEWFNLMR